MCGVKRSSTFRLSSELRHRPRSPRGVELGGAELFDAPPGRPWLLLVRTRAVGDGGIRTWGEPLTSTRTRRRISLVSSSPSTEDLPRRNSGGDAHLIPSAAVVTSCSVPHCTAALPYPGRWFGLVCCLAQGGGCRIFDSFVGFCDPGRADARHTPYGAILSRRFMNWMAIELGRGRSRRVLSCAGGNTAAAGRI